MNSEGASALRRPLRYEHSPGCAARRDAERGLRVPMCIHWAGVPSPDRARTAPAALGITVTHPRPESRGAGRIPLWRGEAHQMAHHGVANLVRDGPATHLTPASAGHSRGQGPAEMAPVDATGSKQAASAWTSTSLRDGESRIAPGVRAGRRPIS